MKRLISLLLPLLQTAACTSNHVEFGVLRCKAEAPLRLEDTRRCDTLDCDEEAERLQRNVELFQEGPLEASDVAYRLFLNPWSTHASMIEVSQKDMTLQVKHVDRRMFCGGRVFWSCKRPLGAAEWPKLNEQMTGSAFWQKPSHAPAKDIRQLETDGDVLVMEGFVNGQHHVIVRTRAADPVFWNRVVSAFSRCTEGDRCCLAGIAGAH